MINLIMRPLRLIAKLLFNRIFYVVFALLVQLVWIFSIVFRLTGYSRYISFALNVLAVFVVLWIVNRKINPYYKLVWTIVILTVPVFGLVLYLLFGESRVGSTMQKRFARLQE